MDSDTLSYPKIYPRKMKCFPLSFMALPHPSCTGGGVTRGKERTGTAQYKGFCPIRRMMQRYAHISYLQSHALYCLCLIMKYSVGTEGERRAHRVLVPACRYLFPLNTRGIKYEGEVELCFVALLCLMFVTYNTYKSLIRVMRL